LNESIPGLGFYKVLDANNKSTKDYLALMNGQPPRATVEVTIPQILKFYLMVFSLAEWRNLQLSEFASNTICT